MPLLFIGKLGSFGVAGGATIPSQVPSGFGAYYFVSARLSTYFN